ncbi:hypothetical protein ACIBFB_05940 [Nocardiopsis sp. NPDC050513]|uniref:hypothetical protein n=1 Tax=Nocardiopsis sp. NPDC050513 TaxID=3364338 RepID=UPI0037A541CD
MRTPVTTSEEFVARWRTPPNFPVAAPLIPFGFQLPKAVDVLDHIRRDNEVRYTVLDPDDWQVRLDRTAAFRSAPLEELLTWRFRLVHFNLSRFYTGFLEGFQEAVMTPWRTLLSAQGFTWQRCAPLLFISSQGTASTYHNDNSHGLVWQVEGVKTFHSYVDPDRVLTAEDAVIGKTTAEEPPANIDAERLSIRMEPGDMLWSHALTPHWVTSETPLSMSINLSHGALCHHGVYAEREVALRRYWDDHPAEAWLHDLRNTRY